MENRSELGDFMSLKNVLQCLEKSNLRLNYATIGLAGAVLVFLAGERQKRPVSQPKSLEAQKFILRAEDGKARILSLNPFDGKPSLSFHDEGGNPDMTLGYNVISFDGNGVDDGVEAASFGLQRAGTPGLDFRDKRGLPVLRPRDRRRRWSVAEVHGPGDRSRRTRMEIKFADGDEGGPSLTFYDRTSKGAILDLIRPWKARCR